MRERFRPLFPERVADAALLTRLLGWLGDAEPAEGAISPPGRAAALKVHLRDGRWLLARRASHCVTAQGPDSTRVICRRSDDELILHLPGADPVRVWAPALTAWLQEGWRQDIPTVAPLVVEPLTGGLYHVHGDGWPGVEVAQIWLEPWLEPEGPFSCCPPSEGSRLAEVPVVLGQFAWEGEVPGEGPFTLFAFAEGGVDSVQVNRNGGGEPSTG